MATNFTPLGSFASVVVTGPTSTVDVLRISFQTIPSNIIAVINATYGPTTGFTQTNLDNAYNDFIEPTAEGIERVMTTGMVAGMVAVEDSDASGNIVDFMDVTVQYVPTGTQPGPFQSVLRIPTQAFGVDSAFFGTVVLTPIENANAALQALAGL